MITYLLDTKVCIATMRGNPTVVQGLASRSPEDCAILILSVSHLFAGVFRCKDPEKEGRKDSMFLEPIHLLPFDWDSALKSIEIRLAVDEIENDRLRQRRMRVFLRIPATYSSQSTTKSLDRNNHHQF